MSRLNINLDYHLILLILKQLKLKTDYIIACMKVHEIPYKEDFKFLKFTVRVHKSIYYAFWFGIM